MFNQNVLINCKNAKKYVHGTSWIPKSIYEHIDVTKKQFKISTLAGSKLYPYAKGHGFRQVIHHAQNELNMYPITFFRSSAQVPHIEDYGNNPFLPNSHQ